MVNENGGGALRTWILFVLGCGIIIILAGKWLITGSPPDPALGGIALILVGFGNMLLQRGGS